MTCLEQKKLSIEGYYNNKRSFIIRTVSKDSGISNKMWLTLLLWIHHCEKQVASRKLSLRKQPSFFASGPSGVSLFSQATRKLLVVIINHGKFT